MRIWGYEDMTIWGHEEIWGPAVGGGGGGGGGGEKLGRLLPPPSLRLLGHDDPAALPHVFPHKIIAKKSERLKVSFIDLELLSKIDQLAHIGKTGYCVSNSLKIMRRKRRIYRGENIWAIGILLAGPSAESGEVWKYRENMGGQVVKLTWGGLHVAPQMWKDKAKKRRTWECTWEFASGSNVKR